ncbi:MAG: hypothetical protein KDM64_04000 [Verrucomicrobiae bacterium]|nr:hypothetical protein [Verrucomicrobiae bacterium]
MIDFPRLAAHHDPGIPPVVLTLDCIRDTENSLAEIKAAAGRFPGNRPLHLQLRRANGTEVMLAAGESFRVSDDFTHVPELRLWLPE